MNWSPSKGSAGNLVEGVYKVHWISLSPLRFLLPWSWKKTQKTIQLYTKAMLGKSPYSANNVVTLVEFGYHSKDGFLRLQQLSAYIFHSKSIWITVHTFIGASFHSEFVEYLHLPRFIHFTKIVQVASSQMRQWSNRPAVNPLRFCDALYKSESAGHSSAGFSEVKT